MSPYEVAPDDWTRQVPPKINPNLPPLSAKTGKGDCACLSKICGGFRLRNPRTALSFPSKVLLYDSFSFYPAQ